MILIDKLNVDMRTMKSSWNEDRVAASYCNRRPAKKQGPRPSALYAQHKINTDIVTVFTRRGREVYTRRFGDVILSSRIDGDDLKVEIVNGGRYVCDAWTGELLEGDFPVKPEVACTADCPVREKQAPKAA